MAGELREGTPHGRAEIPEALIAACERLCSSQAPALVSVRDIAEEARVTTGLVHHYFDSKDALVAATLRSMSTDIAVTAAAALETTGDPGEMVRAVWRLVQVRPAFTMIAAWWTMEGRNVTEAMGEHPFIKALAVAIGAPQRPDAVTQAAVVASMILGGNVMRVGLNRALGREDGDQELVQAMETAIVETTRSALPSNDDLVDG